MRAVPASILQHLARQDGATEPVVFVDIYHRNEGMDSLSTRASLEGVSDVSRSEGGNTAWDNSLTAMVLGTGGARALDTSGALSASQTLSWNGTKRDIFKVQTTWKLKWNWLPPMWVPEQVNTYIHHGWDIRNDAEQVIEFRFTAASAMLVDSIGIGLGNAASNLPAVVSAVLLDSDSGAQVGSPAQIEIAAGSAHAKCTLNGPMGARLFKGKDYRLRLTLSPRADWVDALYAYKTEAVGQGTLRLSLGGLTSAEPVWAFGIRSTADNSDLGKIMLGGKYAFAASGDLVRNLDVGSVPALTGTFGISNIVPVGSGMTVTALYATNDAATAAESPTVPANWTLIAGPYTDGMALPSYRYWRIAISMTPTAAQDESPALAGVTVLFDGAPMTLGSRSDAVTDTVGVPAVQAVRAVHAVSASAQALDAQLKTTMVGQFTIELAPEPEVVMLSGMKLRGKRVVVRAGVVGNAEHLILYSGMVRDLAWGGGRYVLTLQDPYELADVSVPNRRHDDWSAATNYTGTGELVVAGDKAYRSILAGLNYPPATNPTYWADYPSVLKPVTYSAGMHLADIAADILANQINIPDRYLNFGSLDDVKALHPARTIGAALTFSRAIKARQLLDEIALLLEAQWMVRDGRITLVADAGASPVVVESLTAHDIAEGLEWRGGQAEVKNGVLLLSGWTDTNGNEQWARGVVLTDATSVQDYGVATLRELKDRFGLSSVELQSISQTHLDRWKNGRQLVRVKAWMGKLAIEAGDIVELRSAQLPPHTTGRMNFQVTQSSLDWNALTLNLTLTEV